mgnify:CR=1 FL=1
MEAKNGSNGFDFNGVYDEVKLYKLISYTIDGGRKVKVIFTPHGNSIKVIESFEADDTYTIEMQKAGWKSILDNFKKYTESYLH